MGLDNPVNETGKPLEVNKQMLEIKRKIQLSEGRRKAAFEDCISEHKRNAEKITNLKKNISELVSQLHTLQTSSFPLQKFTRRLEHTIGPVDRKTDEQITHLLDLQVTDRRKSADLVRYRIGVQQRHLAELAERYRILISGKNSKEIAVKCDRPVKKSVRELENSLHAVQVQLREASHISQRYKDLKMNLEEDATQLQSGIRTIEQEIEEQKEEIEKLQKVMEEATRMRAHSRTALAREERRAICGAHQRERQTNEGRRLVTARQHELEILEKRISHSRKTPVLPVEALHDNEAPPTDDEDLNTPSEAPGDYLSESLTILKQSTGCDDVTQLLQCFVAQSDTFRRLQLLKKQTEIEKSRKERQVDSLAHQLHEMKFTQDKDLETNEYKLNSLKESMGKVDEKCRELRDRRREKEDMIAKITLSLKEIHACVNPHAVGKEDLLEDIRKDIHAMMERAGLDVEQTNEETEDKWLPNYYSGLVRTTPLPQSASSPQPQPIQGSEEEEEVPSRNYLKRQAQVVVDAKSRRKHVRIQRT